MSVEEKVEGLVKYLVTNIVDDKDAAKFETVVDDNGDITINVTVAESDIGHVIGKEGHIIKSIRTLSRACATKDDVHVDVEIID